MNAEEVIIRIIDLFTFYLEELNALPRNAFIHGEMTAYVETLELIQKYYNKYIKNLDYVIEDKYKI